jgi:hypothetical protein
LQKFEELSTCKAKAPQPPQTPDIPDLLASVKQAALIGRAFTCDKFGNTFDGAILVLVTVALFIQHSRALLDLDLGKAASDLNKEHPLTNGQAGIPSL